MIPYRSRTTTHGRNMAGARGLWRATGMTDDDFGKPIITAIKLFVLRHTMTMKKLVSSSQYSYQLQNGG